MLPAQREDDSPESVRLRSAHCSLSWSCPAAQRALRSREVSEPRWSPTRRSTFSSPAVRPFSRVRIATPAGPGTTKGAASYPRPPTPSPSAPVPQKSVTAPNGHHRRRSRVRDENLRSFPASTPAADRSTHSYAPEHAHALSIATCSQPHHLGAVLHLHGLTLAPFFIGDDTRYHAYFRRAEPVVVFGVVDSGVPNRARGDGLTFLDLLWEQAPFPTPGRFVRAVRVLADSWLSEGLFTPEERESVVAAAVRADLSTEGYGQHGRPTGAAEWRPCPPTERARCLDVYLAWWLYGSAPTLSLLMPEFLGAHSLESQ
jgi:hypothetical protein